MKDKILAEAKRLYDLGFAIHWLHEKSKRPIESKWTTGPRKSWDELLKTYHPGLNVGVRLGTASKVKEGFLGVIDVDVKSKDSRHRQEVSDALKGLIKGHTLPEVISGRGNGSRHLYVLTDKPLKPRKALQSPDIVKVHMPSVSPSKKEIEALSTKEIEQGLRLRNAWEIAIMGEGQQVVLPPSIHPDSGKNYAWQHTFNPDEASQFDPEVLPAAPDKKELVAKDADIKSVPNAVTFEVVDNIELGWLPISDKVREMILTGAGVTDRSAMLLGVASALVKAKCTLNEVLTILTEPKYFMGRTAYDHAQTKNRDVAARWLYRYTVKKAFDENSAAKMFEVPIEEPKQRSEFDIAMDQAEFDEDLDWRLMLDRTEKGNYKATLNNVVSILKNMAGRDCIRYDSFSHREFYSKQTPWAGVQQKALEDIDSIRVKSWIGDKFGFEPSTNLVNEALTFIAKENSFDPVLESLENLPAWDGVERLDTWLANHFEAEGDPEYLAQVFRKWIVAMVVRTYEPGAKFDWMPIFEGPQGAGKSSFGNLLVGDKYFLDWLPDLSNKDAALALQGAWGVEMGELAQFRKSELEAIKAFITRTTDKIRPPYGVKVLEIPRRCVFFGTTNSETYLKDDSGNRRFKPVKVGWLNFEQLREDRDQLFAEALMLYKSGFESARTLELTDAAKQFEREIHAEKMVSDDSDLMADLLRKFFTNLKDKKSFNFAKFRIEDFFEIGGPSNPFGEPLPLKNWKFDTKNAMFAAKALRKLGAEKWKSHGRWFWKLPKLT